MKQRGLTIALAYVFFIVMVLLPIDNATKILIIISAGLFTHVRLMPYIEDVADVLDRRYTQSMAEWVEQQRRENARRAIAPYTESELRELAKKGIDKRNGGDV